MDNMTCFGGHIRDEQGGLFFEQEIYTQSNAGVKKL